MVNHSPMEMVANNVATIRICTRSSIPPMSASSPDMYSSVSNGIVTLGPDGANNDALFKADIAPT